MVLTDSNNGLPDIDVFIAYSDVFNDFESVNPKNFIQDIPTHPLLHFAVELQNKILYAITDYVTQKQMMADMRPYLPQKARKKAWDFQKEHKKCGFISCDTTLLFFQLVLSNFVPMQECHDESELELDPTELIGAYKALLYCNQIWINKGITNGDNCATELNSNPLGLYKISLRLELPIVEFKFYKNPKTQFYKAIQFFIFCENDKLYQQYLQYFYQDHRISSWKEYITRLFCFFSSSVNKPYITIDSALQNDICFFDQFTIDITRLPQKDWKDSEWLRYLRNHFLIKTSSCQYFLLNANLLIDKMYQGMKFDFLNSLKKHNICNNKGRKYDYNVFSSELGERFSEPQLLYPILHKCYDHIADVILDGKSFQGIDGCPDFYIRIKDSLFLFEYKDNTLSDKIKFSRDENLMEKEITQKLCYDGKDANGNPKRKGGGQLLATIHEILNNHTYDSFDKNIAQIKRIFPIIITTDSAFSSLGVNGIVTKAFNDIILSNNYNLSNVFVYIPTIINIDTIINMCYPIHEGIISLQDVLIQYIDNNTYKIQPFDTFIEDNFFRTTEFRTNIMIRKENEFLFGEYFA